MRFSREGEAAAEPWKVVVRVHGSAGASPWADEKSHRSFVSIVSRVNDRLSAYSRPEGPQTSQPRAERSAALGQRWGKWGTPRRGMTNSAPIVSRPFRA